MKNQRVGLVDLPLGNTERAMVEFVLRRGLPSARPGTLRTKSLALLADDRGRVILTVTRRTRDTSSQDKFVVYDATDDGEIRGHWADKFRRSVHERFQSRIAARCPGRRVDIER